MIMTRGFHGGGGYGRGRGGGLVAVASVEVSVLVDLVDLFIGGFAGSLLGSALFPGWRIRRIYGGVYPYYPYHTHIIHINHTDITDLTKKMPANRVFGWQVFFNGETVCDGHKVLHGEHNPA